MLDYCGIRYYYFRHTGELKILGLIALGFQELKFRIAHET